jgi:CubicO group peptidase (beta-lactamase class C family)
LLLTTLVVACEPIHGQDPSALPSRVEEPPDSAYADVVEQARPLVRDFIIEGNLPGLSVAVGVGGELIWAEGFGWADVDAQVPVTPETRFRIGSLAMPMTATAVGLLHERGMLDWDAPVRHYVPSFPEKGWPVSTRQLMGHVAGIRPFTDDEEPMYMRRHCDTAIEGLELFADAPLRFEPGTDYLYSPYGWTLVGAVVEAVADEPYLDFLQREVLDPLEMSDTILDDPAWLADDGTRFYWPMMARDPSLGVESAIRKDAENTCLQGGDGLLSTPKDMVRFGLAMIEGRLLRPETLATLQTPLTLESGESTDYGLGWFVGEIVLHPGGDPTTVIGHEGSAVGGTSSFVVVPEHGIVIAVTTNVSFARSLATERELGAGARPFFREAALPYALAEKFLEAGAAGR